MLQSVRRPGKKANISVILVPKRTTSMRWKKLFASYSESGQGQQTGTICIASMKRCPIIKCRVPLRHGSHFLSIQTCCSTKVCMAAVAPSNTMSKSYVSDLKIGMVPIVNLEWISKAHSRHVRTRPFTRESVAQSIVRDMDDYIHHIVPQFSRTHINFQRVPTVDTSNPFSAKGHSNYGREFCGYSFSWASPMSIFRTICK